MTFLRLRDVLWPSPEVSAHVETGSVSCTSLDLTVFDQGACPPRMPTSELLKPETITRNWGCETSSISFYELQSPINQRSGEEHLPL